MIDDPAAAAWKAKRAELEAAMRSATDLPVSVRAVLDQRAISKSFGPSVDLNAVVTGIPASFLLDQNGNVVAMNLRGEWLEAEVKRLLKL